MESVIGLAFLGLMKKFEGSRREPSIKGRKNA